MLNAFMINRLGQYRFKMQHWNDPDDDSDK